MKQTYVSQPVECILVDDCGDDHSVLIAQQLIDDYKGPYTFKIIANEQNLGLAASRNVGIKMAQGKYVFFLDSDDSLKPGCLETLASALEAHPGADVVIGNAFHVKANQQINNEVFLPDGVVPRKLLVEAFFRGMLQETVWNMLISADTIRTISLYFVEGLIHEDTIWTFRLITEAACVVFTPHTTLVYEDNPTSITNTIQRNCNPHLRGIVYIIYYFLDHFPLSHYVDATLSILGILNREIDTAEKCQADSRLRRELMQLRNRIFKRDIVSLRLTLTMFELQLFLPFRLIHRSAWYRHHYHAFSQLVRRMALFFDPLHFLNRRKGLTPSNKQ
jgi:glycosyltransferase involved in cell wall biosynthesis